MKFKILVFGIAKEIIGSSKIEYSLERGNSVSELKDSLSARYPKLLELNHFFIALNEEYAEDGDLIDEGDEIVIIPPVSGG